MSIIGDKYEQEIWESDEYFKKRMEEFLSSLEYPNCGEFDVGGKYYSLKERFLALFEKELKS